MKLSSFLFVCFILITKFSYAQQDQYRRDGQQLPHDASTLSVFSENGEQFFLMLNGISQNNTPVSKIRIEGLPQYGNDIRIMFPDGRTPEISKRVNITDPVDGREVNMTLKIVRDRDGYAKLKFQKCSEIDHYYRPEQDEYVMNYGQPQQANISSGRSYGMQAGQGNVVMQPASTGPVAMDPQTFHDAKQSIANASFEDTKLSTAKTILAANYVSTDQVVEICRLFSFENSKLDFNNYYKVGSVFDFDSNKQALNDFISRGGR
jgi:hypothetical protein